MGMVYLHKKSSMLCEIGLIPNLLFIGSSFPPLPCEQIPSSTLYQSVVPIVFLYRIEILSFNGKNYTKRGVLLYREHHYCRSERGTGEVKATLKTLKLQNTNTDGRRVKTGSGGNSPRETDSYPTPTPHSRHRGGCSDGCMIIISLCSVPVVLGKPKGEGMNTSFFFIVSLNSVYGLRKLGLLIYSPRARYRSAKFRILPIPPAHVSCRKTLFYRVKILFFMAAKNSFSPYTSRACIVRQKSSFLWPPRILSLLCE